MQKKELIKIEKEILPIKECKITKNSLQIPENTNIKDWLKIGEMLKTFYKANKWWIGDWINFGEHKYGEMYAQALDKTDYDYGTLRNYKLVANKVEMSRRRDNLSFSHHEEIAKFEPKEQEKWLDLAEKNNWDREQFRLEIKQARYTEIANEYKETEDIKIIQGDFRKVDISDNSIDLILTDPPYPEEYLELWQDLFLMAEKKLKPSSFLVAYSGQMYLDKIFKMKNELIYYWIFNIGFTKKPIIMGRNVINEWKPILVFQKAPFKKREKVISDKLHFGYTERELHDKNWGQTIAPFEFLVENFSKVGDTILEPFAGTGTTLIACKNKKRNAIGIEIEEKYINLIKGRLNENN